MSDLLSATSMQRDGDSNVGSTAQWPYYVVTLVIALSTFLMPGLSNVVAGYILFFPLAWWLFGKRSLNRSLIDIVLPFVVIIAVGLLGLFKYPLYDVLKDVWYSSKPVLFLIFGYAMYWSLGDIRRFLKALVISGCVVSLVHLSEFAFHPELLRSSAVEIRNALGKGYYAVPMAFALVVAARLISGGIFRRWAYEIPILALCGASIVLSFSRTLWAVVIFLSLSCLGYLRYAKLLMFGVVCLFALTFSNFDWLASKQVFASYDNKSFSEKLAHSFTELQVRDYVLPSLINENWRGYETARALGQYTSGASYQLLVGHGFGSAVDLGMVMHFSAYGEPLRFAPVLHNGFAYVLFKTGVVGLFAFLYFICALFRLGYAHYNDTSPNRQMSARILLGSVFVFVITGWVVSGVFNKSDLDPFLILVGGLVAHLASAGQSRPGSEVSRGIL